MIRKKFLIYIVVILFLCNFSQTKSSDIDDYLLINSIVRDVSLDNLRNTIADLQTNNNLDPPYEPYKSRYCLRVRDTNDPSDEACDNAADYIYNRFASFGLEVEYQTFVHEIKDQGKYVMRNVVATLPGYGINKEKIYIICAHYDSTAGLSAGWMWYWKSLPAPGADDNASGVAAVIEAARILSQYKFQTTIKFIAFSGEELGMFGSKDYARLAANSNYKIIGVLNLDMIAYDPDEFDVDVVTNEESVWISNAICRIRDIYNIHINVNRIINSGMVYSDHSPFWKQGYNAALFTENADSRSKDFSPVNHTNEDTLDKLNFDFALQTTRLAIATLAQLADPVTNPTEIDNPDLLIDAKSVVFSHIPSNPGERVNVTFGILNLGSRNVENVNVQVWAISPQVKSHSELIKGWDLDLAANIPYQMSTSLTLKEWGDYDIFIKINPDCGIFESDFSNNVVRRTIFISAKLGIGDLTLYPNPMIMGENEKVNIKYKLSQDARVSMEIYDIQGNLINLSEINPGENGGRRGPNNIIEWDGTNINKKPVAPGIYICKIMASKENGERDCMIKKIAILR